MSDETPFYERPFNGFFDHAMVNVNQNDTSGLYYATLNWGDYEHPHADYRTTHRNAFRAMMLCAKKIRNDAARFSDYDRKFVLQKAWAEREKNPQPVKMSTAPKIVKATEYADFLGIEANDVVLLAQWSCQYKQARENLALRRKGERGYAHRLKALRAVQRDAQRHCSEFKVSISYHLPTEVQKDGKAFVINLADFGY
jgi:hypothetical protein